MSRGVCGCSCERTWEGDYSLFVFGEVVKGRACATQKRVSVTQSHTSSFDSFYYG